MMLWLLLALTWATSGHMAAQLVHDQHGPGRHRADLITPATSSASRLTPTTSAPELFDQPDEAGEVSADRSTDLLVDLSLTTTAE